jgi:hypothetical protein
VTVPSTNVDNVKGLEIQKSIQYEIKAWKSFIKPFFISIRKPFYEGEEEKHAGNVKTG